MVDGSPSSISGSDSVSSDELWSPASVVGSVCSGSSELSHDDLTWIGDSMDRPSIPDSLRIATWNVHKGLHSTESVLGSSSKLDTVLSYMGSCHIDILCITEPGCSAQSIRFRLPSQFAVFGSTSSSCWVD